MRRAAERHNTGSAKRPGWFAVLVLFSVALFYVAPANAQLACYQWRSEDNGFDSGWRADNKSVIDAWKAAKDNGAELTGCGSTSRLYEIGTITPTGSYPYFTYIIPAKLNPAGPVYNAFCNLTLTRVCGALFYVNADASPDTDCGPSCNGVGKPISPASGNEFHQETDVSSTGPTNPVEFRRYYNSRDTVGSELGIAWRHSYSRSIASTPRFTPFRTYSSLDPNNSSLYATESDACTTGFTEIKARNASWASASASYSNNACTISIGGVPRATLRILFSDQYPQAPGPAQVGYTVTRDSGQTIFFALQGSTIVAPAGISLRLQTTGSGFQLTDDDDNVESYDATGRLLTITSRGGVVQTLSYDGSGRLSTVVDSFGHALTLGYDGSNRLVTVTTAASKVFTYGFDASSRLASVTNPDTTTRTYQYTDPNLPNALTGIVDEATAQYVTIGYDAGTGKATSTQRAGGVDKQTLVYNSDGSVTVTDALGALRTFTFSRQGDRNLVAGISGSQCPTCRESKATTYDAAGFVASRLDYRDFLTTYVNDPSRGLETSRTEGLTSAGAATPSTRTITTSWHTTFRLPTSISVYAGATATGTPVRTTSFTYDAAGNVLTRTVSDPAAGTSRTWTFTHDTYGRVLTADGPRTDVSDITIFTYYPCSTGAQCGQLSTVTNAANQVTTYNSYDALGQPTQITDPNGVVTTLAYDSLQRVTDRCVNGLLPTCSGGELTHLDYWPTGLLKKVTLPDGSNVNYLYDNAHRLTQITDGLGNRISYSLNLLGSVTGESAYDPTNVLARTRTRVFNALNQLYQEIGAANTAGVTTTFGYDLNGNQTTVSAPLSRNTTNGYDELNRLTQVTDAGTGVTQLQYDVLDNLTQVTDPRLLVTTYQYNGFGDVKQLTSPDTGITTSTFDSGGNVATVTDARNAISTFTYDALNRVKTVAYKIGTTTDQTVTFNYDAGTNGKGRLTSASDANHSLTWTYDAQGRVTGKSQTLGTVTRSISYAYTNGNLTTLTTPSGQSVVYGYSNGQIASIAINGTTLLSGVVYEPFGPVRSWTWGNGTTEVRLHNTDGNPSQISAIETKNYGYDDAFRITSIANTSNAALSWNYGYDSLDRLTSATKTGTTLGWTYDANGNRLTQTGTVAGTYTIAATSNRLSSVTGSPARTYTYSNAGSVLTYGTTTLTYWNSGRMKTSKVGAAATTMYVYNALGQRVKKSGGPAGTVLMMFDEAGHIVGEYSSTGALVQETVWLGDIPVATLRPGTPAIVYYVHADHLNAPRLVTRSSDNKIAWRWDTDPFGTTAPNQNPQGLGTFVYNLRLPGQYFDSETSLLYNYARDYDPAVGRYVESDPIGLKGGSYSTYTYVADDPINSYDADGLDRRRIGDPDVTQICSYYSGACQKSGGKCNYPCRTAPFICQHPDMIPSLWVGVSSSQINCIRTCLIAEDKKAQKAMNQSCPDGKCLSNDTINDYHKTCYTKCGVGAWRFPGVGPLGN